jgi:3-deoxy-manno-octulosonate cytidylyltransferase (CMP-KDO synthetase)
MSDDKALVVIPARYEAARFPGKPLAPIYGKPMIQWVYEGALQAKLAGDVIVATESPFIKAAVEGFNGKCELTRRDHTSGTDRVWEVAERYDYKYIVNLQGDEPLIKGHIIDSLVKAAIADPDIEMATLCKPFGMDVDPDNPSRVKVVRDMNKHALYFSRTLIPYVQHGGEISPPLLHIGIYLFRRDFLQRFIEQPQTPHELCESLEQLRALEMGAKIWVGDVTDTFISVDEPGDVKLVEKYLEENGV